MKNSGLLLPTATTAALVFFAALQPRPAVLALLGLAIAGLWVCAARALRRERTLRRELADADARLTEEQRLTDERVNAARRESEETTTRFYRELSHELRVPISIIQGYSDLLCSDMVSDAGARREYLQKISEQCSYMGELIGAMLHLARGAEDGVLALERVDILGLLRGIIREMAPAFARQNVTLRLVSTHPYIYVSAEMLQLSRVFYNLLENALKYMGRPGSVNITCSQEGDEVLVVVKDDGDGLSAEELEHVFQRRYHGQNAKRGHGLGLYMVRQLVEQWNGSILAKSEPGNGMGVYIMLPVWREEPKPDHVTTA